MTKNITGPAAGVLVVSVFFAFLASFALCAAVVYVMFTEVSVLWGILTVIAFLFRPRFTFTRS